MDALTVAFFTDLARDQESKIYEFQFAIAEVKKSFRKNALYPYLNQLIELREQLIQLADQIDSFESNKPKTLIEIDLLRNELKYESAFNDSGMIRTAAFIRQCLPAIQATIEEGATIFDFVEQQIRLEAVGIVPQYKTEGYFLVPDPNLDEVNVYRYTLSKLVSADQRFRGIKTSLIKSLQAEERLIPANVVKLSLIKEHQDLPNPATFQFKSEIDFPYTETLFPICKRILLRQVS